MCDLNHIMKNILDTLTDQEKKTIKYVTLKKEQILFYENDVCQYFGVVLDGELSISSFSFSGGEIVYNQLHENDVFGNNLIFASDNHYRGSVIAKKASKVALIEKNKLFMLLKSNNDFLIKYLQIQSDFGKELNRKIKLLSIDSAEERFMYYLFVNSGSIQYKNITVLSKELFMQRETLSRLISRLIKEDKIIKNDNYISVNEKPRI